MPTTTHDWLHLDGTANARVLVPGVLLRADNLQDLSEADIRRLREEHRLEAVVDLRTGAELELEGPGPLEQHPEVRIEHRSLYPETGGATDLDAETVKVWGDAVRADHHPGETPTVRAYLGYLRRRPDSVTEALRTIARADGGVLVHCAAGKDRTGVVVALALTAAGAPRELVVADYLATAERIDGVMARLIASPTYRDELDDHDPAAHAPRPGTMERVLELLDAEHGGAEAWLRGHGLGDDDLRRLRARLAPVRG